MNFILPRLNRAARRRAAKRDKTASVALSRRLELETYEPRILMSAALLPVHGSIDAPGQTNQYTFSLTDPSQVYFDSQTPNANQIDWTLQGPTGTVVSHRSFSASDATLPRDQAVLGLVPGTYTLTVAAQGATTGAYDFQLLDLANATPVVPGQTVDGQLNPGDATNLYRFQAVAGQTLFFDSHALSPQSTNWRVIGPEGTTVFGPTGFGPASAPNVLPETGTYTLLVEGNVNQTALANYSFTVFPVAPTVTPLVLGQTTAGRLETPGATNEYAFTLGQPTTLLFDSLVNRGDLTWTLTGPAGDIVSRRAFNVSDGPGIGGDTSLRLAAGTYKVGVSGAGAAVGAYGFRLFDLIDSAIVSLADRHTLAIDDGGFAALAAHTAAGAPIALSPIYGPSSPETPHALALGDTAVSAAVVVSPLLEPANVTVESWVRLDFAAGGQNTIFQMGGPGTGYALIVGANGKMRFEVDGVAAEAPTAFRPGVWTHVAGTYDGATLRLYVNGVEAAVRAFAGPVFYDGAGATIGASAGGGNLWHGQLNELRIWDSARPALAIGNDMPFTLRAMPGLLALWHLDEATGLTLSDSSGNGLDAVLGPVPGTATELLRFDLAAGQTYFLNYPDFHYNEAGASGAFTQRFFNPNGFQLFSRAMSDLGAIVAETDGVYTLAIEGAIGNLSAAALDVRLVPVQTIAAAMNFGDTVSGTVDMPGQTVAYAFTLGSDTRVLFDTLAADSGLYWTLTGAAGTEVANRDLLASDGPSSPASPPPMLAAGDYVLTIGGSAAATGAFAFRLLDATPGAAGVAPFTLGDYVIATMDQPGGTVLYSFDAAAGDTISFDIATGAFESTWILYDPYGRAVFGPSRVASQIDLTLGATGTYVLAIEGAVDAGSAATVEFQSSLNGHTDPEPLTGTPIVFGEVSSGFGAPNEQHDYVFTAAAGTRLYFDVQNTDSVYLVYSLTGPRGVEIPDTAFPNADGTENINPAVIALPLDGTYRLRVTNPAGYTGGYTFALIDLAQPTAVLPVDGSVFQTGLSPANQTHIYTFDATVGTDVFLAASASYTFIQNIDVRLIDPNGREVQGPFSLGDTVLHIPVTGTYTLIVEGERNNAYYSGGIAYSLALTAIADPAPVGVGLGQTIEGRIAAGGVTDRYTLDLAGDSRLILSSFTNDPDAVLTIGDANGAIRSINLAQAVGYGAGSPVFALPAGSYTLAVSSSRPTGTPSYSFRLYDMFTAGALSPGATAAGVLQPNQSIEAYTIDVAAGERLRITTTREAPGFDDRILVLDPNGRPLAPPASYRDNPAIFEIAASGTYTILFEGLNYFFYGQQPSVAYSLTAWVDPAPSPVSFGTGNAGTLADRSAVVRYAFHLDTDSNVVFNSLAADPDLTWTLTGPNGYNLARSFYYTGSYELGGTNPVLPLKAGDYTLTFTNSRASAGAYSFRLLNLADAPVLNVDSSIGSTLSPGNETLLYRFNATAGVPLSLTTTDPSNLLAIRLIDPFGQQVFGPVQTGQRLISPTATGVYTVMIEGRVWDATPRPYSIGLASVPQDRIALNGLDSPKGPFSAQGQIGRALAFTGLESIQVADTPALSLGTSFTLQAWINLDQIDASNVPILAKAGGRDFTYALGLDSGDRIWLRFTDANNDNRVYTNFGIAPGNTWTQVTGVVDGATRTMSVYINGVLAAQQAYGSYTPVDSGSPLTIAADKFMGANNDGAFQGLIQHVAVWNVARSASEIQASYNSALTGHEAGLVLYLPLNDPSGANTVADLGPNALTATVTRAFAGLNNVVEGRISRSFGTATYTFSLGQAADLLIDGLSDDDAFSVVLTGPDGLSVTRAIRRSDSFEFNGNPVFAAPAGNYTMVVSAASGHVGSYGFRLLDLSAAVPVALNTRVNVTLPAGFATQAMSFAANAGDTVVFNSLASPVGNDMVSLRLIDPLGRLWAGPLTFNAQTGIPALPMTGTYMLLIEGRTYYNRFGPLDLAFELDRAETLPATLQIGAPNPNPGPLWGAGLVPGQGLILTGADEVTVPDGPVTDQTGSFTIQAMVNLTRFEGYTPIATKVAASGSSGGLTRAYGLYVNANGSIVATLRDASGEQSVTSDAGLVVLNQWANLALVVDRTFGTMQVLLNGAVVGTSAIRTSPGIVFDGPLVIGATEEADAGYGRMEGGLAYVRMWSLALTPGQIAAAMAAAPAPDSAGLVLDLPFAEGTGTVSANIAAGGGNATLVGLNTDGVTGHIARAGQSIAYSFTLAQTAMIAVDSLSGNTQLNWLLSGPYGDIAGNRLSSTNGFDTGGGAPVYTLQAGTYRFTVSSFNGGTGYYNIRLIDVGAQATALTLGSPVSGVLNPASRTQVYSFSANAGDTFFFDPLTVAGEVSWRLVDPSGRLVCKTACKPFQIPGVNSVQ